MRVLVIAAHPDDEVLGVGGTIARHRTEGHETHVHIACMAGLRDREQREADALRVSGLLWCGLTFGDLPQLGARAREASAQVERVIADIGPEVVYTHHPGDLNPDHRALAEAVAVATRPYASGVRAVRLFETPSSTEWGGPAGLPPFLPTLFVEIDLARKIEALHVYGSELREPPHPRSERLIRHRAGWWGGVSGFGAAEAFVIAVERW